ncbi:hypothetical protein BSKO_13280 [Bryopsis sp. KO-2023]|nr:hypothetical protein BSKO_13280 [Bryopsis sp. KO-2023]
MSIHVIRLFAPLFAITPNITSSLFFFPLQQKKTVDQVACAMGILITSTPAGEWPTRQNTNNPIEISFMTPHTIVPSQPTLVHFHFDHREYAPGQACVEDMLLVGRQGGEVVVTRRIDSTTNVASMEICSDHEGVLEFSVERPDGTSLCKRGFLVAMPGVCCEELSRVFEKSLEEVRQSMPMQYGNGDPPDQWRIAKIAWNNYFRCLLRDLGQILQAALNPQPRSARSPPDCFLKNKVKHLLAFLVNNMAYKTGDFMLKAAIRGGHPVTLGMVTLHAEEIDLESMFQRFHGLS